MRSPKIIVPSLGAALFAAIGFVAYAHWQNSMWEMQTFGLARYEGSTKAERDFQSGKLRIFVFAGARDNDTFSGTNDGPYEVWYPQYYPKCYPFRYREELMVKSYNDEMRDLESHPKKILNSTNTAAPR